MSSPQAGRQLVSLVLLLWNLATFYTYGMDKRRAKRGQWRIPESRLLLMAALFGSLGALLGMLIYHHKTQKARFFLGVPALLVLHVGLAVLLLGSPSGFLSGWI